MKNVIRWLALGLVSLGLAACASSNAGSAPQAIEAYIKALVAKDKDAVVAAACAKYEENAKLEADSFAAVTPTLDGLSCSESGKDGDSVLVACKGSINVTYNNEVQALPLAGRTYVATQDNGEWRMCGYQ
jgi:hypothetical protein